MTEEEWQAGRRPREMLRFLYGRVSDRKLRLFACACVRRRWHLLQDERSRAAVDAAERYADGQLEGWRLGAARGQALRAARQLGGPVQANWPTLAAAHAAHHVARAAARYAGGAALGGRQWVVLHEVFGNPFRPWPPSRPGSPGTTG
jgi:hypothetical protein